MGLRKDFGESSKRRCIKCMRFIRKRISFKPSVNTLIFIIINATRIDSNQRQEVRNEALDNESPNPYLIAFNPRTAKYKEALKNKAQSA